MIPYCALFVKAHLVTALIPKLALFSPFYRWETEPQKTKPLTSIYTTVKSALGCYPSDLCLQQRQSHFNPT